MEIDPRTQLRHLIMAGRVSPYDLWCKCNITYADLIDILGFKAHLTPCLAWRLREHFGIDLDATGEE